MLRYRRITTEGWTMLEFRRSRQFRHDRGGSAARWFALAAAGLSVASLAGAHGLDWLTQSGRISLVAYRAPSSSAQPATARRDADGPGVDMTATGSVPPGSALVIRIR